MSIFKRNKRMKNMITIQQHVLSGSVEFVIGKEVLKGRIFGKPFRDNQFLMQNPLYYYVREIGSIKVHKVPDYAIEEVNS